MTDEQTQIPLNRHARRALRAIRKAIIRSKGTADEKQSKLDKAARFAQLNPSVRAPK